MWCAVPLFLQLAYLMLCLRTNMCKGYTAVQLSRRRNKLQDMQIHVWSESLFNDASSVSFLYQLVSSLTGQLHVMLLNSGM